MAQTQRARGGVDADISVMSVLRYAELQATSHFSFLRGASGCDELFSQAAVCGIEAVAICDHNTVAGIVRAHEAAKLTGVRLIVGCRLDLTDGTGILVYPLDRAGYGRLCRLLSLGKSRAGKAKCQIDWADLAHYSEGLVGVLVTIEADELCALRLKHLKQTFGENAYLALSRRYRPRDALRLHDLCKQAVAAGVPTIVTNNVLFHEPARQPLQDVMACTRLKCTVDQLGLRRESQDGNALKPPAEMARLFRAYPEALARTIALADRLRFNLEELAYQYPDEVSEPGKTPQRNLAELTWEGAKRRYPEGVPNKVIKLLKHELGLIEALDYAPYFLTVNSIVRFARSQDILCQGRGSAANSAVCYVLGITSIDPERNDLLFERFISQERKEPPDIDVDFEHERREIVMQWVFATYGRDHAALCSTVIRYRARGSIRDVGKALGLPEDMIKALSGQTWAWSKEGIEDKHAQELNLDTNDWRLARTLELARELFGTPRHLSQHPGGFVLTRDRLDELVPIEPARMKDRQVIEWDKDDIDTLKFMNVDCLALGMMSCMKRGLDLLRDHKGIAHDLATIPAEDFRTYRMIQRADTLGVFQIESRAQMAMLPRIKPQTFYDLVIEVAIVRPGPIQGDMVHPYLRRREGKEPVAYPTPELERVLGKTLGVPLFQEQAMRVAIDCAGFTAGEADQLRRAMATFKFTGGVSHFKDKLVGGMIARGYTPEFADKTFSQLEGFGSYGFPESHAASFALIAYASSWLKCHHPDVFCAALLNAQPMGFYAPAQIVRDAREHGVEVRPICVNASRWDCTLEPTPRENRFAVRLGLRMARRFRNADGAKLVLARGEEPFRSLPELWRRAGLPRAALDRLAEADAFRPALQLARREALWTIKGLRDTPMPLFDLGDDSTELNEPTMALKPMTEGREVVEDYGTVGLSLRAHPVGFLRPELKAAGVATCEAVGRARDGKSLKVAGLVLVRQRPGSAKGVMFITIEDETGVANLVVWEKVFEKHRRTVLTGSMLKIDGRVQREGEVVHLIAYKLEDLTPLLSSLGQRQAPFVLPHGRGDEGARSPHGPDPRASPYVRDIYVRDLHIDTLKQKPRDFR